MRPRFTLTALAVGTVFVAGGCASAAPDRAPSDPAPSESAPAPEEPGGIRVLSADEASAGTSASLEQLEAIYRAREDSARMNVSEADVAFMNGMIPHHAQALVMSAMAPDNAASPAIRTLTARIINAQRDEIAVMQRWLRERDLPVPEVADDGRMVEADGMAHEGHDMAGPPDHADHSGMAGMLSPEQLEQLRAARGADFDRLFLTFMIQHHEGAVTMVNELFSQDGAAQDEFVFKLASDIQADQTTEVARMRRMLEALPAGSPTPS